MRNLIGLMILGSIIVSVWFIFSTKVDGATPAQCRATAAAALNTCIVRVGSAAGNRGSGVANPNVVEQQQACFSAYQERYRRCG